MKISPTPAVLAAILLLVRAESNDVYTLSKSRCKDILMREIMRSCGIIFNPVRDTSARRRPLTDLLLGNGPEDLLGLPANWIALEEGQWLRVAERINRMQVTKAQQFEIWQQCCQKGKRCDLPTACSDEDD